MKRHASFFKTAGVFSVLCVVFFPASAYAYLDPGSGSYFYQMLLAALLAIPFAARFLWQTAANFFKTLGRFFSKHPKDRPPQS